MPASTFGKTFWFDLPAIHLDDAKSFYEALFQWKFLRLSDEAIPDYWVIQAGDDLIGGLRKSDRINLNASAPLLYFTVADLETASRRIRELGGTLKGEKVDLGKNRGCYQWFTDREGNTLALWASSDSSET